MAIEDMIIKFLLIVKFVSNNKNNIKNGTLKITLFILTDKIKKVNVKKK